ncbi:g1644 [Coccomyxa viridis]|uniref:Small RNA 2'-O-methyltransferase n=1 Tax=Coccomyxa viridis TaxID=1274662 RepID=A0ABP1FIG1_9CHLO
MASAKAAEAAWAFVQGTKANEAFTFKRFKQDLWTAICSSFTPEGMLRDADLRGHVWLALLYSDGQLPATTLCNAKAVSRWYRNYDLHNVGSMAAIWKRLSSELQSHLGRDDMIDLKTILSQIPEELRSGPEEALADALSLPKGEDEKNLKSLQATVDLGNEHTYTAVVLPADHSCEPYEVSVEGGGLFAAKLLDAFGGASMQLLNHGKVGPAVDRLVLPGEENTDPENDKELHAVLQQFYGPLPSRKRRHTAETAAVQMLREEVAQVTETGADLGPGLQAALRSFGNALDKLPTIQIRNPNMYSLAHSSEDEVPLNLRASWLAGHPVRGDALLSKIRLRPHEWRQPSEWLHWQMVPRVFGRQQGMRLVTGIPDRFQSIKQWKGPLPEDMLAKLWTPGLMHERAMPDMQCEIVETPQGRGHVATLDFQPLGSATKRRVSSALMANEASARQDAALGALRLLDAYIRSIAFHAESPHARSTAPLPPHFLPVEPPTALEVFVMEPGGGPEPNAPKPAGSAVEFNYSLRAPAFENKLVEAGAACKATLKTGALAPELDALLDAVGTKGKARCKGLWRPEAWGEVDVEVELLDWKAPTVQALDVKLFDVPMAQQRYAYVLGLIKQHSAQSVVDLGCGDGRLLEYLLQQDVQLKALTGVDHNTELAQKAQRRLESLAAEQKQQGTAQHNGQTPAPEPAKPAAAVLLSDIVAGADISSTWGSLRVPDLATMIEVIEHMDPHILGQVGQAVLGSLKPKVLVVTTPNREYNPVLQHLGNSLIPPNNTRNSDHRFEWTRAEFQTWAEELASTHSYAVAFDGIGRALEEQKALQDPSWPAGITDIGTATQVAIFTSKDQEMSTPEA